MNRRLFFKTAVASVLGFVTILLLKKVSAKQTETKNYKVKIKGSQDDIPEETFHIKIS